MRVEVRTNTEDALELIDRVVEELSNAQMPKTTPGKEYVVVINNNEIHIFWANTDTRCSCIEGSIITQDNKGCRKIDWFEIFVSGDIVQRIHECIWKYWEYDASVAEAQLSLMYNK